MTSRSIIQIFENYQKARLTFVQTVAELALRPQNVEILWQAGALAILRPLLVDVCQQIQQCTAIAVGRLAHSSPKIAQEVINQGFLPDLLANIDKKNKYFKKSALFLLKSLCKHDTEMAEKVCHSGGLEALIVSLEDFEPTVKEGAAWAIGYIARHDNNLAQHCVDAGAVPLLTLCLQEPELTLKQIATNALCDIAKHNVDLAQAVVDSGAIPQFARSLSCPDEKLKRLALSAMCACAKHSTELAEVVVEAETFPAVLIHLAHPCPQVRKCAACLVRDVVKHSLELTELVINTGGIGALMEVLRQHNDEAKIPCITALGYISGHSDQLALSVLGCNGIVDLASYLFDEQTDDATLSVTVWTFGQIGKHGPEHANAIATANVLPRIAQLYELNTSSEDLKGKCKSTLKQILQKCLLMGALEPLLYTASSGILKYVLGQFSKVLPNDPKARRMFVTSGALKRVQEIVAEPGTTLMEYITVINACFPEEIVRYYTPGYPDTLLEKVEAYSPQMATMFREINRQENGTGTEAGLLSIEKASGEKLSAM